jgi:hypothetical protein
MQCTEAKIIRIMRDAISTANIDHPNMPQGTIREQIIRSSEESDHLAKAAMAALELAGFEIVPKVKDAPRS